MIFRYAGPDIVDLKEADWVELVDSDNRTIRIAHSRSPRTCRSAKSSKRAIRRHATARPRKSNTTRITIRFDGVQTPFQITRERNGIKVYQVFFDKCDYNTGLADSLFTKRIARTSAGTKSARKKREKKAK